MTNSVIFVVLEIYHTGRTKKKRSYQIRLWWNLAGDYHLNHLVPTFALFFQRHVHEISATSNIQCQHSILWLLAPVQYELTAASVPGVHRTGLYRIEKELARRGEGLLCRFPCPGHLLHINTGRINILVGDESAQFEYAQRPVGQHLNLLTIGLYLPDNKVSLLLCHA